MIPSPDCPHPNTQSALCGTPPHQWPPPLLVLLLAPDGPSSVSANNVVPSPRRPLLPSPCSLCPLSDSSLPPLPPPLCCPRDQSILTHPPPPPAKMAPPPRHRMGSTHSLEQAQATSDALHRPHSVWHQSPVPEAQHQHSWAFSASPADGCGSSN